MSKHLADPEQAGPPISGWPNAFAVPGQPGLAALRLSGDAPPRPEPLARLAAATIPGLCLPREHLVLRFADGPAPALLVDRPPGEPIGRGLLPARAWGEAELIACVLRPIAAALAELQRCRITYRAIRPDSVFQAAPGEPVTLGPAWSRPSAMDQPAWLEPPYVTACHPSGRGDGTVADDVYALGALLVLLSRNGEVALSQAPAAAVVAAKIAHGSLRAMVETALLPPVIAELVRGMLADDPNHRPTPAMLSDRDAARARRSTVRPLRRAERALPWDGASIWEPRALAHAVALDPPTALAQLADGRLERWARLALGDTTLGAEIEAVRTGRGGSTPGDGASGGSALAGKLAVCRLVAVLDPLAPMSWDGLRFWPDGLGPLTALSHETLGASMGEIGQTDAIDDWLARRGGRAPAGPGVDWRAVRGALSGGPAGWLRLRYHLNPLLACQGALARHAVIGPRTMSGALEQLAGARPRPDHPLDVDALLFAHVRTDGGLREPARELASPLGQLSLLVKIEQRWPAQLTPALAAWLVASCAGTVAAWPGRAARERLGAALATAAAAGALAPIEVLLRDRGALVRDRERAAEAAARLRALDVAIGTDGARVPHAGATEIGHEIAVACSALFAAVWVLAAAFG